MKISNIVVTGDDIFLYRYKCIFDALTEYFDVNCIPSAHFLSEVKLIRKVKEVGFQLTREFAPVRAERFYKNAKTFVARSKQTEFKLRQLENPPDLVIHIFNLCCPFWDKFDIPYAMYLDYTMSLLSKNWAVGAPFKNQQELNTWLDCERQAYARASYLFAMSNLVKSSLIKDYGIAPEKITTVGSCANHQAIYTGEKVFGSQQILFNGSEFERKGGDLVLAAFKQVKKILPASKLVIVGKKVRLQQDGVSVLGSISSPAEMRQLFLNTDLVAAPARCDPFPSFLIEAMNYGVPCVVADQDGMTEIVDHGVNGITLKQPTPEILAEEIINLLSNLSRLTAMSQQARLKVKTKLNCQVTAKNISQVLLA